jgi:hypothetical protein
MKRILRSFLLVLIAAGVCSAQSVLYFPQFVDGKTNVNDNVAWGTVIYITNAAALGSAAASVTITLTNDNGASINMPLIDTATAQPVANNTFLLAAGQSKFLLSPSNGQPLVPLNVGFATVTSNLPVAAGLIFIEYGGPFGDPISRAGVSAAPPLTRQGTGAIRYTNMAGTATDETAVAIANPGTATAAITFQLSDTNGNAIGSPVTRTVAAHNHTAFYVSGLFPNVGFAFFGTLRITSDNPIVATALDFSGNLFATSPVFPLP